MSEPLRTAIIACGSRAIQMAKIVSLLPEFKLVAMSDPHPAQRAEAFNALPDPKYYESTEEMLDRKHWMLLLWKLPRRSIQNILLWLLTADFM